MARSPTDVLREQGRGITGALLVVGLSVLYTMETWWLGSELPIVHLLAYALGGLAFVFVLTEIVGFRESGNRSTGLRDAAVDFAELVFQSLLAALVVLTAFGVVGLGDSLATAARLVLVQMVPLGFGAALANVLLAETGEGVQARPFTHSLGVFALGAVFVTAPIAPTQEIAVIAGRAGWPRLAGLIVLSVLVSHLVLHELEFRGHAARVQDRSHRYQIATAFVVYAIGVVVSVALLAAFQQFANTTASASIQLVVVHAFPAAVGASGAEVVL